MPDAPICWENDAGMIGDFKVLTYGSANRWSVVTSSSEKADMEHTTTYRECLTRAPLLSQSCRLKTNRNGKLMTRALILESLRMECSTEEVLEDVVSLPSAGL
jgi:hypothetical protein